MGFMSGSAALSIFKVPGCDKFFSEDKLRARAFTPQIDDTNERLGWVGFGDMLDCHLGVGVMHGNFAAFSLRVDTRKPGAGAIKLQLAEAIREEEARTGGIVSRERKQEIKESVTMRVTAATPFSPSLVDCIVDFERERLLVSTLSEKVLDKVCQFFVDTFGCEKPEPLSLSARCNLSEELGQICRGKMLRMDGWEVSAHGTAHLGIPESGATVTVKKDDASINAALESGYQVFQAHLLAVNSGDWECEYDFVLAANLNVSGLKLPRWGKDDENRDGIIFLQADFLGRAAALVELLGECED